jgi:hypothetical protein
MFNRFSQNDSLVVALTKTFDGKHPCPLCKIIEKNKKSDQKQNAVRTEIKIDCILLCDSSGPKRSEAVISGHFVFPCESALVRYERPPVPPPRFV